MTRSREAWLLAAVLLLLTAGAIARPFGSMPADVLWAAADLVALVPAVWWVVADLRAGRWGADILAVLALASTVAIGEFLAGAIIAAMVATGKLLEAAAGRRARRDLAALLDRAPQRAHVRRAGEPVTVAIGQVGAGDRVVVRPGEVVPADGTCLADGLFDESALTGEAEPVARATGDAVRSGVVNAGAALDLLVSARADASTYAGVVRLAEQAAAASAPVARLADRVAVWFLPLSLSIAAAAWLVTGEPGRAVAVLVTATPCPLLLAVPVAVTGGLSRASRAGVVVKDGGALELLGRASRLAIDKTGTVTEGQPEVGAVVAAPGVTAKEALGLAAAVEQYSPHVLAAAVVRAARQRGIPLAAADSVTEEPGFGACGTVAGERIQVGRFAPGTALPSWARAAARRSHLDLASLVWVRRHGEPVAALLVRDRVRPDASRTLRRLRAAGIDRVVLLTGDRVDNATEVAGLVGVDEIQAGATPADKIGRVRAERRDGVTVMVGDGVNDAPALAAADVGVALGSRGSTAAAQAADAVILDDRIAHLADAMEIARRTRRLAVQSAGAGTGLSLLAMAVAAFGLLVPVAGAVVQEAIDVAVILNSLRILRGRKPARAADPLLTRFAREHTELLPVRAAVRDAADSLAEGTGPHADAAVGAAYRLLVGRLLPHEMAEEHQLYPVLDEVLGGPETTVTMSRGHAEIVRLIRRLGRHLAESPAGLEPDQVDDVRATLYGLDAVLNLHFAQEEEAYFSLAPPAR
ncbi:heavy metal translocating P-type ATPase [Amycolatopsis acidicola]|uniref:Heavy metal translocating P-type ATPase n=1 Tax=Amycolatopsis acidicola TaxID=2596893 RepID=A0A5N0V344_9PSEU|nr:heavy metal translocating P-type ATPase [Amycolatopsis acidicola]KAA9160224.1 heavy metal translocating P-type ATPase [Amycolatopsis acidicola]